MIFIYYIAKNNNNMWVNHEGVQQVMDGVAPPCSAPKVCHQGRPEPKGAFTFDHCRGDPEVSRRLDPAYPVLNRANWERSKNGKS